MIKLRYIALVALMVSCKTRDFAANDNLAETMAQSAGAAGCVEVAESVKSIFDNSTDMFVKKFLSTGNCPTSIPAAGSVLTAAKCKVSGAENLGRVLISERHLYKGLGAQRANGLFPRFVEIWDCGTTGSIKEKIFIAGPGPGAPFHVIAFDPTAGGFNFYSGNPGKTPKNWTFHGNSYRQVAESQAGFRDGSFPHHPCTQCHVSGGLIMRELRLPWSNWHGVAANGISQLQDASSLTASNDGASRKLVIAEHLEREVMKSNFLVNQVRVKNLRSPGFRPQGSTLGASTITLQGALKPLFCQTEVNLTTVQPFHGRVAVDLYLNRSLIPEGGKVLNLRGKLSGAQKQVVDSRFDIDSFEDDIDNNPILEPSNLNGAAKVAFPTAPFDLAKWRAAIAGFGVSIGAASGVADGKFAMPTAGRSHVDDDYVTQLVRSGIIEEKFAADVLLTDFPNPVFSATRCDVLKVLPEMKMDSPELSTPQEITAVVRKAIGGSTLPGAAELKKNMDNDNSLTDGAKAVMDFATKCQANFKANGTEFLKGVYLITKTRRLALEDTKPLESGSRSGANVFQEERKTVRADDNFRFAFETFVKDEMFPKDNAGASKRKFNTSCAPVPL